MFYIIGIVKTSKPSTASKTFYQVYSQWKMIVSKIIFEIIVNSYPGVMFTYFQLPAALKI